MINDPDQYLNDSYRLVILRKAIAWIGSGVEIHNPLNSAEMLSPNKKAARSADSTIAYSINGSWYFNKTNTFSCFAEESIGSIQFNDGEIISMMLPTKLYL